MDVQGALSPEPEADAEGERSAMGERVLDGEGEGLWQRNCFRSWVAPGSCGYGDVSMAWRSGFRQAVAEAHGGKFYQVEAGGSADKQEEEIERR